MDISLDSRSSAFHTKHLYFDWKKVYKDHFLILCNFGFISINSHHTHFGLGRTFFSTKIAHLFKLFTLFPIIFFLSCPHDGIFLCHSYHSVCSATWFLLSLRLFLLEFFYRFFFSFSSSLFSPSLPFIHHCYGGL